MEYGSIESVKIDILMVIDHIGSIINEIYDSETISDDRAGRMIEVLQDVGTDLEQLI